VNGFLAINYNVKFASQITCNPTMTILRLVAVPYANSAIMQDKPPVVVWLHLQRILQRAGRFTLPITWT